MLVFKKRLDAGNSMQYDSLPLWLQSNVAKERWDSQAKAVTYIPLRRSSSDKSVITML